MAQPAWQLAISTELSSKGISGDALKTISTHFRAWCEIPGWLYTCRKYLSDSESCDLKTINSLLDEICSLRWELKTYQPPAPAPLGSYSEHHPHKAQDYSGTRHSWYTFNEREQVVGDYCSYVMALALLQRIILTLSPIVKTIPEDLEEDCQKLAATVIKLHSRVLKEASSRPGRTTDTGTLSDDPGPRNRIIHLRCAFAIAITGKDYQPHLDYTVDVEGIQRRSGSEPEQAPRPVNLATFDHFHDMLRARVRV